MTASAAASCGTLRVCIMCALLCRLRKSCGVSVQWPLARVRGTLLVGIRAGVLGIMYERSEAVDSCYARQYALHYVWAKSRYHY